MKQFFKDVIYYTKVGSKIGKCISLAIGVSIGVAWACVGIEDVVNPVLGTVVYPNEAGQGPRDLNTPKRHGPEAAKIVFEKAPTDEEKTEGIDAELAEDLRRFTNSSGNVR